MKSSCSARGLSMSQNLAEIALILSVSLASDTHSFRFSLFHLYPPIHTPALSLFQPIDLHSVVSFSLVSSLHVLCRLYLCISLFPLLLVAISTNLLNWSVITTFFCLHLVSLMSPFLTFCFFVIVVKSIPSSFPCYPLIQGSLLSYILCYPEHTAHLILHVFLV